MRDMLYDTIHDVQRVLIILELPEYRAHNPEYSKDNIRTIVANFTSIFRALLLEKAKHPIGSEKAKIIYTAYGND